MIHDYSAWLGNSSLPAYNNRILSRTGKIVEVKKNILSQYLPKKKFGEKSRNLDFQLSFGDNT